MINRLRGGDGVLRPSQLLSDILQLTKLSLASLVNTTGFAQVKTFKKGKRIYFWFVLKKPFMF